MNIILAAIMSLVAGTVSVASFAMVLTGPVHDPHRLLSPDASDKVREAAETFRDLTGRWMVIIVSPPDRDPDLSELKSSTAAPDWQAPPGIIGLVYAMNPDVSAGRMVIVDPDWQAAVPEQWNSMFPQRLAEKFGEETFERRVISSARYLAEIFPDRVAFVLRPRGGKLSPGSVQFARGSYIGLEILGYFIVFFTAFRTFWPARLRDEDQDDFSNELRRLKKERQIW